MNEMEKEKLLDELEQRFYQKKVEVIRCREEIILPKNAHFLDAGYDVYAAEETILYPGETKIIPTGLKVGLPRGYELQVRPRSGLSLKTPLRISNAPGTIDCGYKDEIGILMTNTSTNGSTLYTLDETENHPGIYKIQKGDRIAQLVLCSFFQIEWSEVKTFTDDTNRGGGFGHSGIKG